MMWTLWTQDPTLAIGWVFWCILSICLHELGHGVAAIWQGDDTPIRQRHMNMNPLVHMGWLSIAMCCLVGLAWGAMPVNPARFRHGRLGDALVSAAGPLVNLILAFITLTALGVLLEYGPAATGFTRRLYQFLSIGGTLNLCLLFLNLIPVPPLDGSRIVAGLSRTTQRFYEQIEAQGASIFGLLMVLFFMGPMIWRAATVTSDHYDSFLHWMLP